jgi:hypothetical protein
MKFKIIITAIFYASIVHAQIIPINLPKEELNHLYNVKSIQDFIYRFNDDTMSSLRQGLETYKAVDNLNRKTSLQNCFNLDKNILSDSVGIEFSKYVLAKENKCVLNFADSNWYCKAKCVFKYRDADIEIPLVLTVKDYGERGQKWLIVGIDDNRVFSKASGDTIIASKKLVKKSITATNYVTNFNELHKILTVSLNEKSCFEPSLLATEKARKFINMIKTNELSFSGAYDLNYYFLQIPNYIIEVKDFNRSTNNSGLLINKIIKTNDNFKSRYKKSLLKQ